ncbi:single-stranded DNA-binding protein [Turicibacter sanguinis]|uniref:single-stranded DNA-binding protein n=1 Tax=Turicibacter sanguinis TaxID=154288 RepID=UPI00232D682D|nr:single-stranded DNA-binding protein [Turicibacter sanguinis]MDB8541792.1 single-stranded DNA-binding protein [Turicibacter sanguinis]
MLNNVVLVGRVVRQPELSQTIDGKKVSTITLAVTRSFKNALSGEYETDFINITLWEGIAKSVVEYCGKGAIIGVKARLVHKTYEVPNYKSLGVVEVVAEKVSFIQTKPIERQELKELSTEDQDLIEVLL